SSATGTGGDGGFGAGGGAGAVAGGNGGAAGGAAGTTGGGGGAGLGGGVFVAEGGSISISGNGTYDGNTTTAGAGGGDGSAGQAAGDGIFLQGSGNLVLRVRAGQLLTINDSISDSVGAGLLPASSFQQWNLVVAGGGPVPVDSANPSAGSSYGTVILGGNNTIGGDTYITGANVQVNDLSALGGGGVVALDDGGLLLANGLDLTQDLVVDNGGGRIGVVSGNSQLSNDISGTGDIAKTGAGALVLNGSSSHNGNWIVREGALVLDGNNRLGTSDLMLDGGILAYGAAFNDLRGFNVTANGGTVFNNGFDVTLGNAITGWAAGSTLTFAGTGTTTLSGANTGDGNTLVSQGRVEGRIATGGLTVNTGSTYALNGSNQQIGALSGAGTVELGNNRLTITMGIEDPALDTNFGGLITGTGGLTINRKDLPSFDPLTDIDKYRAQNLSAGNTYSGGTIVGEGVILALADDTSIGTGSLTLAGGAFSSAQSSSNINITLVVGGGVFGDLTHNGVISGVGTFVKYGAGTLTLTNANTYIGDTRVFGEGSYLALANPDALGIGNLQLSQGGGLRVLTDTPNLRPIQILDGVGVVDVGSFDVQTTGGITGLAGDSSLRKEGTGRLLVTGTVNTPGGVNIAAGTLQLGNGGTTGSITGNVSIGSTAELVVNRSNTLTLTGNISGDGSVLLDGTGTVTLNPGSANTFLGGLTVRNGTVAATSERGLGFGAMTLDDNGRLLLLGDISRNITIGAGNARLAVDSGNSFRLDGDLDGTGNITKTGDGTLLLTGITGQNGLTTVAAGTLQIGEGLKGALVGDVDVNSGATLVFGRDDLTLYTGVIDGDGTVIKRGNGELVLTGEQLFDGVFQVETGNLRIGLGGTTGSLSGDADLAAGTRLIFDRSDNAVFNGGTTGAGLVQKTGPGELVVVDSLAHTGGTRINSGILTIGNGGTTGDITGDVITSTGAQLAFNRSDDIDVDANVSGAGTIVQRGSGVLTLSGTNTQTAGVLIENGTVAVDSDARLGSGDLIIDGGLLRLNAAFDDLRNLILRNNGGGIDTNGFDINYSGLISGTGPFVKDGAGTLVFTGGLNATLLDIQGGVFQLGDLSPFGTLAGDVNIANGATFSLSITGDVTFNGTLAGSGTFRQLDGGELRMGGNYNAFTGLTVIEQGSLRLDGILGGGVDLFDNTTLRGIGTVNGNVTTGAGSMISPGNSIGTLTIGGDLTLDPASLTEIEINGTVAGSQSDVINVGGVATLDGTLRVLNLPGNYSGNNITFTFLNAGSISGQFATVDDSLLPFLDATV
ncbi:MAG: autotransporter-associated beta strand repeat-containing protein, partial [Moraxellaceae bacterium]|nr:autotransporter-associated beta strand repeat-containing protein [Moraxellaceae bacterium]